MTAFFFYGTLRDAEMRLAVVGYPLKVEPAWLDGYRCVGIAGRTYPMLFVRSGDVAEGVLALGADAAAIKRLTAYEGGEYRLGEKTVRRLDGSTCRAKLFLARPGTAGSHQRDWCFEEWRRRFKKKMLSRRSLNVLRNIR